MNNLINYKNFHPYKMILLVVLYAIGATSLPYLPNLFKLPETVEMILYIILKLLTIAYAIYLVVSLGYKNIFKFNAKNFFISLLIYIPCILVCVNNFPIVSLLGKNAFLNLPILKFILYIIICLSIAVFEEVVFRGIIYPVFKEKFSDFKAIIFSSLVFSLCHLVNAFSLNIGVVALQLGYTFLIGAMCAVLTSKSKSIYLAIFAHFIFDLGGLLTDYNLVSGNIWDKYSVIVTAILGIITLVYTIIVYFKGNKNESCNTKS